MKAKNIGLVLLSSFVGIMLNPEFLMASDSITISDLEQSAVTETIISVPETSIVKTATAKNAEVKTAMKITTEENLIKFAWGAQNLVFSDTAKTESGNNVVKVNKMIYAHDYTKFGNIVKLKIGDTFSLTVNGVTKKYSVTANPIDGKAGVKLDVIDAKKGELYHKKVGEIYTSAIENGWKHDLALLTCYNGGRYVVTADEIR